MQSLTLDLASLVPLIDWTEFFSAWELPGRYPALLDHEESGHSARALFDDAQNMLSRLIDERWLTAKAVFGLWAAASENEDILFYADETRQREVGRWVGLRQQHKQPAGRSNLALADFIGPDGYVGAFALTTGLGIDSKRAEFAAAHDDYSAILLQALADRLAEAAAEWLHAEIRRTYWGYAPDEALTPEALLDERFVGIRPAPGYAACPDHTAKQTLFDLLDATKQTGITLTDHYAMSPTAAITGLYLAHPEARYFAIPKIGRDQLTEWAQRKGMAVTEAERWLSPVL